MNPLQQSPKKMVLLYYLTYVSIAIILLSVLNLVLSVSTALLSYFSKQMVKQRINSEV